MSASARWSRVGGTLVLSFVAVPRIVAQEALDGDRYAEIVLRAHPSGAESAGLELAAGAERTASRRFPDPTFVYSRDRARPVGGSAPRATETGYSVSQTIPWPGTLQRRPPRRGPRGRCAAGGSHEPALGASAQARQRLRAARRGAGAPRRRPCRREATRAPCATSWRVAPTSGSRASPTASRPRSNGSASSATSPRPSGRPRPPKRSCARSPSSLCPSRSLIRPPVHEPLPRAGPRRAPGRDRRPAAPACARRARKPSASRRCSPWRAASRIPDLDVTRLQGEGAGQGSHRLQPRREGAALERQPGRDRPGGRRQPDRLRRVGARPHRARSPSCRAA